MPMPVHLMNSTPLLVDGFSQQSFSSQFSRSVVQPPHFQCEQTWDSMTNNLAKSHDGHSEMKSSALMEPGDLFKGNLQNGVVGAQVIPSSPNMWPNQHSASQNSRPGFCHLPVAGQSDGNDSIPKLLRQQILLDAVSQNHVCDNKVALQRFTMPHMRTNGNPPPSSHEVSLTSGTKLLNRISGHTRLSSIPCSLSNPRNMADVNHSSAYLAQLGAQSFLSSRTEEVSSSNPRDQVSGNGMLSGSSDNKNICSDMKHSKHELITSKERMDNDLFQAFNSKLSSQKDECVTLSEHNPSSLCDCLDHESGICSTITANAKCEGSLAHPLSGDDLFNILGTDFKNKLLSGKWNNVLEDGPYTEAQIAVKDTSTIMNMQEMNQDVYAVNEAISVSGIFSSTDTDNLLDAVVFGAHSAAKQSVDDNVSCRTTLIKTDSSSVPNDSLAHCHANMSDQHRKGLFDFPKLQEKAGTEASSSIISCCTKDGVKSCSQSTSLYGSQLSSWVEQAHNVRRESSVATGYSKKNAEVSKTDRKKLKPGENPRPRPKDRQMIQDRVKELREIVPNGAKCSIDALLERTIKHMLFLQSVTKHADKLKQTGEAKIINKEGGVLVKDNFEGGATWAFEVGSQSMVCPIIVEDLNPPRQMLVEMLCEERGFFLEIADLIRGLGLTILKGVMEAQNDKIWARFAVEANRDVTRMEIFMSLVHLLEQTMKDSTSAVNALSNSAMIHQAFPQAAFIPASGGPSSLQ
uniref:Transcription factor LHW-like isoform X1 n=1 Tax=Rhizophora mucronata TaxID=61149 RepID=A0A2P2JLR9_RHIMU